MKWNHFPKETLGRLQVAGGIAGGLMGSSKPPFEQRRAQSTQLISVVEGLGNLEAGPYGSRMMSLEWLGSLARYNRWMNEKLLGLAATLSDETRKSDKGAFFRSIHGTFNHLLIADRIWLARFTGTRIPEGFLGPGGIQSLDQELYSDFEELRRERARTDDELSAWVAGLTVEQLSAPLVYLRRGQQHEFPLWWAAVHVFNHQTHHRGQITTLLSQLGCDPGITDLVAMLREEAAASERRASP